ncbi:Signal peptidase I [Candidatus Roizmanbacteria bacterium]|nr:Signal peptidase I [Candidatus Roizmanbacteria bacterium]
MKILALVKNIFLGLWLFCIVAVFGVIFIVVYVRKELFTNTPSYFSILLGIFFLVGFLSFLLMILISALLEIIKSEKNKIKKQIIFLKIIKFFVILALFPFFSFINIFHPKELFIQIKKSGLNSLFKDIRKKLLSNIFSFFMGLMIVSTLFAIWFFGYFIVGMMTLEVLGFNPRSVPISGTGSMFPTFPKSIEKDIKKQSKDIIGNYDFTPYPNGLFLFNKRYFGYKLSRNDIVTAYNKKISENSKKLYDIDSGVVKRIIGLPGDSVEIKNGLVYINGKALIEPYTAKPHSTFGEAFLSECKKIKIPENKYFLMGDNRKGSGDSREFGWVDEKDIDSVIPFEKQKGILDKNYRNTSKDLSNSSKINLNKQEYLKLLNEKRKETGAQLLKYQPLLEKSAYKRGEVILKYNDFSFEATKSAYTMSNAMNEVNYWNPYYGEAPTQGYFDSKELLENQFEYANSKKFLLDNVYQEVGIIEIEGEINGCPTQIIVQHFAGYVSPNYKKENVESWRTTFNQLVQIQSGWEGLKNNSNFYNSHKQDVDRINVIIGLRISNIKPIVDKMEANQWLSKQQTDYTYQDENLSKEQEQIANKLNSK